jgi:hypothetical protein
MIKSLLSTSFVLLIFIPGHTQVLNPYPISGTISAPENHDFIQLTNNKRIELAPLYEPNFAYSLDDSGSYSSVESRTDNDSISTKNAVSYHPVCRVSPVEIVDSIDLNGDGVKELFVLRQSECSVSPSNIGPYGEGGQQQTYGAYEVWDVKRKRQLFQVKNIRESQVAISTNVIQNFGYRFEVTIDQKGRFHISGLTDGSDYEPGTYAYNAAKGVYVKE